MWLCVDRRGLVMGLWNSHTSVGNIAGSLIAGAFVETDWALSFIVPGLIIVLLALPVLFFLVPREFRITSCHGHASLKELDVLVAPWHWL